MGKKKKDTIADQLNALQPNIPTQTRVSSSPKADTPKPAAPPETHGSFSPFGLYSLFNENLSGLGKIQGTMLEHTSRSHGVFLESCGQVAAITYDLMDRNWRFLFRNVFFY